MAQIKKKRAVTRFKLTLAFVGLFAIICCGDKNSQKNNAVENGHDSSKVTVDSTLANPSSFLSDTVFSQPPFSVDRLGKKKPLPAIDSIKYLPIGYHNETALCGMEDKYVKDKSTLLDIFTYYNNRLNNIGKYEAYFITIACQTDSSFVHECACRYSSSFGFVVLYSPMNKAANVIMVQQSYTWESLIFSIRENRIEITSLGLNYDEETGSQKESIVNDIYLVEVSKSGEISISKK